MFTGIVEEMGRVDALELGAESARLTIRADAVTADAVHGASIAVDGCCLTVVSCDEQTFTVDVMRESLDRTSLRQLRPGSAVNLERALRADGRLGGHIVQGHVDGTGTLLERTPGERWEVLRFGFPQRLARYVVEKGSIGIDGVSLTVASVQGDELTVSLIPTTLELTTLGSTPVGASVNLEVDVLAKYVERQLQERLDSLLPTAREPASPGAPAAAGGAR